jgi:DNA polymerase III subunit gamma/tau
MPALYRTYRPQNFKQVIGQEIIKTTLQNAILNNRTVHSYLFSGPRGTGKTTMARIFAKALNCTNHPENSAEPCNKCDNCKSINNNAFIDLIEIDAASNRGIDEIRNLKEAIRFAPSQKNGYKIYIIDEAHMLTKDASNALLKTLEEPPHNTIFILATTDAHKMIPTILSRVQKFDFKPLSYAELKQKILFIAGQEKIKIDEQVVNQIILQAMGGARDAESILGKLISGGNDDITLDFASSILGKHSYFEAYTLLELLSKNQLYEAIRHIHKLYNDGYAMEQLIVNLLNISHNVFLIQINPTLITKDSLLDDEYNKLELIAENINKLYIRDFIQALESIKSQTHSAYLPYLPLELIIAKIWDIDNTSNPVDINPTSEQKSIHDTRQEVSKSIHKKTTSSVDSIKPEPKIEPKLKETVASSNPLVEEKASNGDVYSIYKIYPLINKTLTKSNKSLAIIFAQTQPVEIIDNIITIAVDSDFYRSRLEKNTNLILEHLVEHNPSIIGLNFITQKVNPNNMMDIDTSNNIESDIDDGPKDLNDTIADIFKDSL